MKYCNLVFVLFCAAILVACQGTTDKSGSDLSIESNLVTIKVPGESDLEIEFGDSEELEISSADFNDVELRFDFDGDIQSIQLEINGEELVFNKERIDLSDLIDFDEGNYEFTIVFFSEKDAEGEKSLEYEFTIEVVEKAIEFSSEIHASSGGGESSSNDMSSSEKDAESSSSEKENSSSENNSSEGDSSSENASSGGSQSSSELLSSEGSSSSEISSMNDSSSGENSSSFESSSSDEGSSSSEIDRGVLGKFEPPDGKTLMIIGQNRFQNLNYIDQVRMPAGFMSYTSFRYTNGMEEHLPVVRESFLSPTSGAKIKDYNAQSFVYMPENYDNIVMQIASDLMGGEGFPAPLNSSDAMHNAITNGELDHIIERFGNHFKYVNVPVFFRLGYEINGKYQGDTYQKAYKYIYNYLTKTMGLSNIAFVWHITIGHTLNGDRYAHDDWYPGDEYVDWIAVSYFDELTYTDERNPDDVEMFQANLDKWLKYAKDHDIPFMLAECTPMYHDQVENGEDAWNNWYESIFKLIEDHDIKAFSYINQYWHGLDGAWPHEVWGNSRVQDNSFILNKWQEKMDEDRYVNGSEDVFGLIGFSPEAKNPVDYSQYSIDNGDWGIEEISEMKITVWYESNQTNTNGMLIDLDGDDQKGVWMFENTNKGRYELHYTVPKGEKITFSFRNTDVGLVEFTKH